MANEDTLVERVEDWLEVTLNRPEKLNSLRGKTAEEILAALEKAEHDRGIAAIILKGSGRAFCTGIDTSEFKIDEGGYFDFYRQRRGSWIITKLFQAMPEFSKPVITVVEGYALGGGLELALLGDIIIAGEKAQLGLPEAKLGIMPGGGGTQTLPRLIGKALAKELMWTGRRIKADEAKGYRLVNHVTEAGQALEKAREIAREIAKNAPLAVMMIKLAVDRGADLPLADGMAVEADASFMLNFSDDRTEGLSAFAEKRPAKFRGQ